MATERSLILVHSPGWQDAADFHDIARRVERLAPEIATFVVSNDSSASVTRRHAAQRPTLVFSPIRLGTFRPRRGIVFEGRTMSKLDEMDRLARAGLPVPAYEPLTPETKLDAAHYGPFVVVKPSHALASFGQGIDLMPIDRVRYRRPEDFPDRHPGRHAPMIVQRFVDCGFAMTCRVLTLFGAPLLTYCRQSTVPLSLDDKSGNFVQADFMPTRPNMRVHAPRDADILDLAARAYAALPDAALQACDILRDRDGHLHILEVNPGGGAWMFSNSGAPRFREALGVDDLTHLFDAFEVCAKNLVEKTRCLAQ